MTPIGSSAGLKTVRENVSAHTRKIVAAIAEETTRRRWPCPMKERMRWGITNPTKPIPPEIATAIATPAETGTRSRTRIIAGSIPTAVAVESPEARASSHGAQIHKSIESTTATTMLVHPWAQLARDRSPRVQNITARAVSGESDEKIMKLVRAWNTNPTASPARMRRRVDELRPPPMNNTMAVEARAPRNAMPATPKVEEIPTRMIAVAAPDDAPALTPNTYGSASGLRTTACRVTPAAPRIAPTPSPVTIRGIRFCQTMASVMESQERWTGSPQ